MEGRLVLNRIQTERYTESSHLRKKTFALCRSPFGVSAHIKSLHPCDFILRQYLLRHKCFAFSAIEHHLIAPPSAQPPASVCATFACIHIDMAHNIVASLNFIAAFALTDKSNPFHFHTTLFLFRSFDNCNQSIAPLLQLYFIALSFFHTTISFHSHSSMSFVGVTASTNSHTHLLICCFTPVLICFYFLYNPPSSPPPPPPPTRKEKRRVI